MLQDRLRNGVYVPGHFEKRIYVDMLEPGDIVDQRSRGKGVVLKTSPRTIKIKFPASTATFSQFKKNTPLIDLEGMIVMNQEEILKRQENEEVPID